MADVQSVGEGVRPSDRSSNDPRSPHRRSATSKDVTHTGRPLNATLPLVEDPAARPTTLVNKRSVAAWLPALVWAGLIFALSAQADLTFLPDQGLNFVVAKLGHLTIFGVLALLLWRALAGTTRLRHPSPWALALTVLYAITDELHQAFVPGRNASILDVGIDAAGAMIAIAIVGFVGAWWLRRRVRP